MSTAKKRVSLSEAEFESVRDQLHNLETEVIRVWACRNDEADGLECILVPLYAARRNLEAAVQLEMEAIERANASNLPEVQP